MENTLTLLLFIDVKIGVGFMYIIASPREQSKY